MPLTGLGVSSGVYGFESATACAAQCEREPVAARPPPPPQPSPQPSAAHGSRADQPQRDLKRPEADTAAPRRAPARSSSAEQPFAKTVGLDSSRGPWYGAGQPVPLGNASLDRALFEWLDARRHNNNSATTTTARRQQQLEARRHVDACR